jgi:hypothetical protein
MADGAIVKLNTPVPSWELSPCFCVYLLVNALGLGQNIEIAYRVQNCVQGLEGAEVLCRCVLYIYIYVYIYIFALLIGFVMFLLFQWLEFCFPVQYKTCTASLFCLYLLLVTLFCWTEPVTSTSGVNSWVLFPADINEVVISCSDYVTWKWYESTNRNATGRGSWLACMIVGRV